MRPRYKLGILLGVLFCLSASAVQADDFSVTWTMPLTPDTTSEATCGASIWAALGDACYIANDPSTDTPGLFAVATDITCLSGCPASLTEGVATPDVLVFNNTSLEASPYPVLEDVDFMAVFPELVTSNSSDQLYTADGCAIAEECPEMKTGTFTFSSDSGTIGTFTLSVSTAPAGNLTYTLTQVQPVPESSTIWMLGLGLISLVWFSRRRQLARWMFGRLPVAS